MQTVHTDRCYSPVGPYSQGVTVHGWFFSAGLGGLDPATGEPVSASVEEQAVLMMENVQAVLQAAGYTWRDVVKATLYLKDMRDFALVNAVYERYLGDHRPARSCVAVADMPHGERVKLEVIAYREG